MLSLARTELLCRMCRTVHLLGVWVCWASLLLTALRRAGKIIGKAFDVMYLKMEDEATILAEIFLN